MNGRTLVAHLFLSSKRKKRRCISLGRRAVSVSQTESLAYAPASDPDCSLKIVYAPASAFRVKPAHRLLQGSRTAAGGVIP